MRNEIFLVAINVTIPDDVTRAEAEAGVRWALPKPYTNIPDLLPAPGQPGEPAHIEEWWIAEDDRNDGSDNDSAVWVHPGLQRKAFEILEDLGYTGPHNNPSWTFIQDRKPIRRLSIFEEPSDEDLEAHKAMFAEEDVQGNPENVRHDQPTDAQISADAAVEAVNRSLSNRPDVKDIPSIRDWAERKRSHGSSPEREQQVNPHTDEEN